MILILILSPLCKSYADPPPDQYYYPELLGSALDAASWAAVLGSRTMVLVIVPSAYSVSWSRDVSITNIGSVS